MATDKQIAANKRSAEKSTGPTSAEGKATVARNALKHGLAGHGVVLPGEMAEQIEQRRQFFWKSYKPDGALQRWLYDRICIETVRADACLHRMIALRDEAATRAGESWEDDRALQAEELGASIGRRPELVQPKLLRSKHGALWLVAHWEELERQYDLNGEWTEAASSRAMDLPRADGRGQGGGLGGPDPRRGGWRRCPRPDPRRGRRDPSPARRLSRRPRRTVAMRRRGRPRRRRPRASPGRPIRRGGPPTPPELDPGAATPPESRRAPGLPGRSRPGRSRARPIGRSAARDPAARHSTRPIPARSRPGRHRPPRRPRRPPTGLPHGPRRAPIDAPDPGPDLAPGSGPEPPGPPSDGRDRPTLLIDRPASHRAAAPDAASVAPSTFPVAIRQRNDRVGKRQKTENKSRGNFWLNDAARSRSRRSTSGMLRSDFCLLPFSPGFLHG